MIKVCENCDNGLPSQKEGFVFCYKNKEYFSIGNIKKCFVPKWKEKKKRICINCYYHSNSIWSGKLLYCKHKKRDILKNNREKICFREDDSF